MNKHDLFSKALWGRVQWVVLWVVSLLLVLCPWDLQRCLHPSPATSWTFSQFLWLKQIPWLLLGKLCNGLRNAGCSCATGITRVLRVSNKQLDTKLANNMTVDCQRNNTGFWKTLYYCVEKDVENGKCPNLRRIRMNSMQALLLVHLIYRLSRNMTEGNQLGAMSEGQT